MSVVACQLYPRRILVVMPTWLGDCVMATPTLAALRQRFPEAHITLLARAAVKPILTGGPWMDRIITLRAGKTRSGGAPLPALAGRLAARRFDLAILLPNSFRSALLTTLARIPRRVGYARDGRSALLTDRLISRRQIGRFVPVPTVAHYLGIARYLGAVEVDTTLRLYTRPEDDAQADELLARGGVDRQSSRKLILINPGGNFGSAKLWMPERFAAVADRCAREMDAAVAVTGAPGERAILDQVIAAAKEPIINLPALGLRLRYLKSIVRQADLLITNDTGTRHVAAAMGTPVVTIFGPTDPAWTVIDFPKERQVRVEVPCGPCQRKICPLMGTPEERICLRRVEPDMVFEAGKGLATEKKKNLAADEHR